MTPRRIAGWLALLALVCVATPAVADVEAGLRNEARAAIVDRDADALADVDARLGAALDEPGADIAAIWFRRGEVSEALGEVSEAAARYQRSIDADVGSRFAVRAEGRLRALADVMEGDVARRLAFFELRTTYLDRGSEPSIAEAEALLAATTDEALQAELLSWLATEELYVRHNPERARGMFLEVTERAADDGVVVAAFHGASLSSDSFGSINDTLQRVDAWLAREDRPRVAASLAPIRRDLIDRRGRYPAVAAFVVAGFALLALALRYRAWRSFAAAARRRWRPLRLALFVAWAFGGAAVLAEGYEHGYLEAFLLCVPFGAAAGLTASATAQAMRDAGARGAVWVLWALATAGATLGAVYAAMAAFGKQAVFGL